MLAVAAGAVQPLDPGGGEALRDLFVSWVTRLMSGTVIEEYFAGSVRFFAVTYDML
jgi:hypothetical protein